MQRVVCVIKLVYRLTDHAPIDRLTNTMHVLLIYIIFPCNNFPAKPRFSCSNCPAQQMAMSK